MIKKVPGCSLISIFFFAEAGHFSVLKQIVKLVIERVILRVILVLLEHARE